MQFEYVFLTEERKKQLKEMKIENTYDGTVYEDFNFGVAADIDQRYVLFRMNADREDTVKKYIFICGNEYRVIRIHNSDIERQEFVHEYHDEYSDETECRHIYEKITVRREEIAEDEDKFIRALTVFNRNIQYYRIY